MLDPWTAHESQSAGAKRRPTTIGERGRGTAPGTRRRGRSRGCRQSTLRTRHRAARWMSQEWSRPAKKATTEEPLGAGVVGVGKVAHTQPVDGPGPDGTRTSPEELSAQEGGTRLRGGGRLRHRLVQDSDIKLTTNGVVAQAAEAHQASGPQQAGSRTHPRWRHHEAQESDRGRDEGEILNAESKKALQRTESSSSTPSQTEVQRCRQAIPPTRWRQSSRVRPENQAGTKRQNTAHVSTTQLENSRAEVGTSPRVHKAE